MLTQRAERLSQLLLDSADDPWWGCQEGATIGVETWQLAGSGVMEELFVTSALLCSERGREDPITYLDCWWDGVGKWRRGATARDILPVSAA